MSSSYLKTDTFLDKILAHKVKEIAERREVVSLRQIVEAANRADPPRDVHAALRRDTVALIAECKKASPSKGVLIEDFDPVQLAGTYAENGAAMISVLTDEQFFQGHLDYMTAVRQAVKVPVLRKDFIVSPFQVYEARAAGADAVLLIVSTLDDAHLHDLYMLIHNLGMTALVEVHTEREMDRALKLGAATIGINNRDLKTFEVDLQTTGRLAQMVPDDVILVAESGISSADDVARMGALGAQAVLVGESLVKAGDDLAATVRAFSSQPRQQGG